MTAEVSSEAQMLRICRICGATIQRSYRGHTRLCVECVKRRSRAWVLAHPERHRFLSRRSRGMDIREDDYTRLLEEQGGVCAICGASEPGAGRKLFAVDHDHATGQVRGLLCVGCNLMVGKLTSDGWLAKATSYLNRASQTGVEI